MARWNEGSRSEWSAWPAYVSAGERRARADKDVAALRKKGRTITPVVIEGRKITTTFWGQAWCDNLESYSDYANRLPRGRTYARNGSVVHLEIDSGKIEALVRGTRMYTVSLTVKALVAPRWNAVVEECGGQVTSLVELLQGRLPRGVMQIVTDKSRGIFPSPSEITLSCSCPDWAQVCKHVAAAMYGVGARLDAEPALLFRLRGVDPEQLIVKSLGRAAAKAAPKRSNAIADDAIGNIFGIEVDDTSSAPTKAKPPAKANTKALSNAKAPTKPRALPKAKPPPQAPREATKPSPRAKSRAAAASRAR